MACESSFVIDIPTMECHTTLMKDKKYKVTMWVPRYATVRLNSAETKELNKLDEDEQKNFVTERAMEDDCWVPEMYEGSEEYEVEEIK
jgi:hypothetical protein